MKPISSWWGIAFGALAAAGTAAAPAIITQYPWSAPILLAIGGALQAITNQGPATK